MKMVKMALRASLFVGFAAFFALPALAWDDVGHKITGYIAWQRMTPQARDNVIRILRSAPEDSHLAVFYRPYGPESAEIRTLEYFIWVPTWADVVRDFGVEAAIRNEVRYRKYHKSNWHYDDIFWRQVNGKVEELSGFPEGGVAVSKLKEFDALIRDSSARASDKAIAIAWILHLGGDIHQPLHTSARVTATETRGDQGGNLFLLTPEGTARENQVNLHWYWDSIVGRNISIKSGMCEREYIEMLGNRMMKAHPYARLQQKLDLGKYDDWQKESFAYNNSTVFSTDLVRNQMPSDKYRKRAFELAEQQLALAGYRLGETLNAVFNPPPGPQAPQ
jgi:hypothetical protein